MSRLFDRLVAVGAARPPTAAELDRFVHMNDAEWRSQAAEVEQTGIDEVARRLTAEERNLPSAEITRRATYLYRRSHQMNAPRSHDLALDSDHMRDAVVFAVDDVADYAMDLPSGTRAEDLVGPLAPPFDRFWLEAQRIRPRGAWRNLPHAWGLLVDARFPDEMPLAELPAHFAEARWLLQMLLVIEWEPYRPVGPVMSYLLPVAEDGSWLLQAAGPEWINRPPHLRDARGEEPPNEVWPEYVGRLNAYTLPLLLALSLTHCRNVQTRLEEPPPKLSRAHERRRGAPLHRYHVLEVGAIIRQLDDQGLAREHGLGRALHICRGHFKTYTEDAPLLGRHIGTYWWPPHARGSTVRGRVDKDYRVRPEVSPLGVAYRPADERVVPEVTEFVDPANPDSHGDGLRAHNRTQNRLAETVRGAGYVPRRPAPNEPHYDVAWTDGAGDIFVAEVKSTTRENEERQLRLAVGQVLRYRQQLESRRTAVHPVVATSAELSDTSWLHLFGSEGIAIVSAPDFAGLPGIDPAASLRRRAASEDE